MTNTLLAYQISKKVGGKQKTNFEGLRPQTRSLPSIFCKNCRRAGNESFGICPTNALLAYQKFAKLNDFETCKFERQVCFESSKNEKS